MNEVLASERVVVAAPMSFAGSTRRIWRKLQPRAVATHGWAKAGWWTLLWTLLVLAWVGVLLWYSAFSIMLVPYRIVRRWQRNGKRKQLRHQETLAAMERRP